MTQPATRKPPNPTLYLLGFDCYPHDREYFEAWRATGSAIPYWFKEKLVYDDDVAARPPTQTIVSAPRKSSMKGTQEYAKDSKVVKVEVRETSGDDEARDETKILNTKKTKEKKKQPTKRPPTSPRKKIITIPLPKRRVIFAWTPRTHQNPHSSLSHRAHTPLHCQRPKKPSHDITQWQDIETWPFLVTTPPPYLAPSICERLLTDTASLPQPADRAEYRGNGRTSDV